MKKFILFFITLSFVIISSSVIAFNIFEWPSKLPDTPLKEVRWTNNMLWEVYDANGDGRIDCALGWKKWYPSERKYEWSVKIGKPLYYWLDLDENCEGVHRGVDGEMVFSHEEYLYDKRKDGLNGNEEVGYRG